jgi:ribosomal protein S1
MAEMSGVRGFLPVSQLATEHYPRVEGGDKRKILEKLLSFIGQNLEVKIISLEKENSKLVFSERAVEEEAQEGIISSLKIGQDVDAEVTGVVDFGLFVKFSEPKSNKKLEGLIHISEVSWDRVENLKEKYLPGDHVKARIIDISDGRVSLSIKRLLPDPWSSAVKKYKLDQIVEGEITRVTPFGAFVRLDKDIEGLVHISEISEEHVFDPREILSVGEKRKFKIITIEPTEHRLGLSLKAIEEVEKPKKVKKEKKDAKTKVATKPKKSKKKPKTNK